MLFLTSENNIYYSEQKNSHRWSNTYYSEQKNSHRWSNIYYSEQKNSHRFSNIYYSEQKRLDLKMTSNWDLLTWSIQPSQHLCYIVSCHKHDWSNNGTIEVWLKWLTYNYSPLQHQHIKTIFVHRYPRTLNKHFRKINIDAEKQTFRKY